MRVLAWPRSRNRADNPYTSLLYDALEDVGVDTQEFSVRRALRGDYDLLHVHWPEGILRGGRVRQLLAGSATATLLLVVRAVRRKPIVWTVHNLAPHRPVSPLALRLIRSALRRSVSGLIYLSETSRDAHQSGSGWACLLPSVVTPHGRYGGSFRPIESRSATRVGLGVASEDRLVAFVGRMEPYKGPDKLVEAFIGLSDGDARLLLAGAFPEGDYGRRLRERAMTSGVLVEDAWLSNERMAELLAAADVVVYPYDRILNSGSVVLPLEFDTRVVAPGIGSIPEVSAAVGGRWIMTYDGEFDAAVLRQAIDTEPTTTGPDLRSLEWGRIAPVTVKFLQELLPNP